MTRDIDSYLRELQAALTSAGADPALTQDALFDAEEYLQAETAGGTEFSAVAEAYGTPEEVAAAYLGMGPGSGVAAMAGGVTVLGKAAPRGGTGPDDSAPGMREEKAPVPTPPAGGGVAPASTGMPGVPPPPPGVQAGMAAAAAGSVAPVSAWRRFFGVFADPAVYKAMVYMILSLATGVTYFTLVVTGVSIAGGMLVLIIGLPLFLLVLGMVRAMALFEGRVVEALLGTRMPRRERAVPPDINFLERIMFWVKDGRTWASLAYMILMLPLGVVYFSVTITGLSVAAWLIASIVWGWFGDYVNWDVVYHGVSHSWHFPAWGIVPAVIVGVIVLVAMMHLIRAMGRGHAAFAKAMLVRLGR